MAQNLRTEFLVLIKYTVVSIISLFVDYLTYYIVFKHTALGIQFAASIGYVVGLFCAYILLKKFVFLGTEREIRLEFFMFLISGMIGILTTFFTISTYVNFFGDENYILAKAVTTICAFIIVYIFRRVYVFI
ncbi:MAG: hypothetical protein EoVTN8_405 [Fluviibacter phosphoraccumulans EoVTN8]